jgi:hypothetical protein
MQKERKYQFRDFLNTVHKKDRYDKSVKRGKGEILIEDSWWIIIDDKSSELVLKAARDLQDYFFTSMRVSLRLKQVSNVSKLKGSPDSIVLASTGKAIEKKYDIEINEKSVFISASNDRALAQGIYYLEDLMNLKEAPILTIGRQKRKSVFSPRMVHSGWGMDLFPDPHLSAMAHSGIDAILVFAKDVDTTTVGYLDFNDLVKRADSFGIDFYFYSYLKSEKHPDEKDALEYYESTYGRIFEKCPGAKGVILVGESCEFPSKDTKHTTGKIGINSEDMPTSKPRPGWWPCYDYPKFLNMITRVTRKHRRDADIVFWTYNWGHAPEKDRLKLINNIPENISLLVTYEMFEQDIENGVVSACRDYTIAFEGPGKYFKSEAKAAKKRGINLYAMSNTMGATWDFGTIPFVPVPHQWMKRHGGLREANRKWNLSGLMESHHYGFYPSFISELQKWNCWTPSPEPDEILKSIAIRDFGEKASGHVIKAWKLWSKAIVKIPTSVEDQNGPLRIGPAYPFVFNLNFYGEPDNRINLPQSPYAHFGNKIVKIPYSPHEYSRTSPGIIRIALDIKKLETAIKQWEKGIEELSKAIAKTPSRKKEQAKKMLVLGKYIAANLATCLNIKHWWLLNNKLRNEQNRQKAHLILDDLETLLKKEIKNAKSAIPLVEFDSRLGWEPSMEYMGDSEHIEWKIKYSKMVLLQEIPIYRKALNVGF